MTAISRRSAKPLRMPLPSMSTTAARRACASEPCRGICQPLPGAGRKAHLVERDREQPGRDLFRRRPPRCRIRPGRRRRRRRRRPRRPGTIPPARWSCPTWRRPPPRPIVPASNSRFTCAATFRMRSMVATEVPAEFHHQRPIRVRIPLWPAGSPRVKAARGRARLEVCGCACVAADARLPRSEERLYMRRRPPQSRLWKEPRDGEGRARGQPRIPPSTPRKVSPLRGGWPRLVNPDGVMKPLARQ